MDLFGGGLEGRQGLMAAGRSGGSQRGPPGGPWPVGPGRVMRSLRIICCPAGGARGSIPGARPLKAPACGTLRAEPYRGLSSFLVFYFFTLQETAAE